MADNEPGVGDWRGECHECGGELHGTSSVVCDRCAHGHDLDRHRRETQVARRQRHTGRGESH
jgi:rRNA maturation endonuclease Nob1